MKSGARALVVGLAAPLLWSNLALGYCRTTTCDPSVECELDPETCCRVGSDGCDRNGLPLVWTTSCLSFSVQKDGSKRADVKAEQMDGIVARAFSAWQNVECSDGPVSISIESFGAVACDAVEYNTNDSNANVWMFRDVEWTHEPAPRGEDELLDPNAIAVTTVSYNWRTGELYDADVEFNSAEMDFSTDDDDVKLDLQAVATHEAGHFLGLDHTNVEDATMQAGYLRGSLDPRTLEPDDEAGLCAIYPPDRDTILTTSCEPRHGFGSECSGGCSISGGATSGGTNPTSSAVGIGLSALGMLGVIARRRRAV